MYIFAEENHKANQFSYYWFGASYILGSEATQLSAPILKPPIFNTNKESKQKKMKKKKKK